MDTAHLQRSFARLGQRVQIAPTPPSRRAIPPEFELDVRRDRHGEFFLLTLNPAQDTEFQVVDVQPGLSQLLLQARTEAAKLKFLCGFDERHLFTAAVPGGSIRSVQDAMQALKLAAVREDETRLGLRGRDRLRRRNRAYLRQGEWFFVPEPGLIVPAERIRRHEPLSRGGGSQRHLCAEAARTGGEQVMVCGRYPGGITLERYAQLRRSSREARGWNWRSNVRNPHLYVRGDVRHRDHATLHLPGWHRVYMNTENEAPGRRAVVFLD